MPISQLDSQLSQRIPSLHTRRLSPSLPPNYVPTKRLPSLSPFLLPDIYLLTQHNHNHMPYLTPPTDYLPAYFTLSLSTSTFLFSPTVTLLATVLTS